MVMPDWTDVLYWPWLAFVTSAAWFWQTQYKKAKKERDYLLSIQDVQTASCNHIHGLLADVCDAAFDDENRALQHGYEGVLERVKTLYREEARLRVVLAAYGVDPDTWIVERGVKS